MKIYAIYKGEKFLCEGTSRQCAEYLGVKPETIRFWSTAVNKRRAAGKTRYGKDRQRIIAIAIKENIYEWKRCRKKRT